MSKYRVWWSDGKGREVSQIIEMFWARMAVEKFVETHFDSIDVLVESNVFLLGSAGIVSRWKVRHRKEVEFVEVLE